MQFFESEKSRDNVSYCCLDDASNLYHQQPPIYIPQLSIDFLLQKEKFVNSNLLVQFYKMQPARKCSSVYISHVFTYET